MQKPEDSLPARTWIHNPPIFSPQFDMMTHKLSMNYFYIDSKKISVQRLVLLELQKKSWVGARVVKVVGEVAMEVAGVEVGNNL